MKKGPHLVLYDRTNSERLTGLDFGTLKPDETGWEFIVWLWNKKDFSDTPTAVDVRVSAVAGNVWAEGIIEARDLEVKSSGVMDPDGAGIVDDAATEFTAIGGPLTDTDNYHSIGDIPTNCARRLFFRINLPEGFTVNGSPRVIVQVGYQSEPVRWLFVADES